MKALVAQLILSFSLISTVTALTVTYSCDESKVFSLTVSGREVAEQHTIAFFAGSSETDADCSNTLDPTNTDDSTFSLTVADDGSKCSIAYDSATSQYSIRLWVRENRPIITNNDVYSDLVFRCEGAAQNIEASVDSVIDTSQRIDAAEEQSTENLALSVELADGSAITGPVSLGDQIRLRVLLTHPTTGAVTSQAARVSDCNVKATPASTTSVKLITDYCGDSSLFNVIGASDGFTGAAVTASTHTSLSSQFATFLVEEGVLSMAFQCRVVFCLAGGDNKCEGNQCATNNARRRRRDVDGSDNSTRAIVTASITIGTGLSTGLSRQNNAVARSNVDENCTSHATFIAITTVMVVVLFVASVIIVFMFIKMSKARQQDIKVGKTNPAF